jgi:predicted acylesterase/phospholipase RssA
MSAAMSAGQVRGLELAGITGDLFKGTLDLYGISSGSGAVAYYASGETSKITSLFSEECTTSEFLNMKRVHKIIDAEFIAREIRNGPKHLDHDRLRSFQGNVYAVAQNTKTGINELLDLKTAKPDLVTALEASSAIPPFRSAVEVDGEKYIDGGFEVPPLEEIIKNSGARKVLVLPNTPFDHFGESGYGILGGLVASIANKFGSLGAMKTLEAHFTALERFKEFLDTVESHSGAQIAILWPPDSGLSVVTNKKTDVDSAILRSARETIEKFVGEQPDVSAILPSNASDEKQRMV